MTEKYKIPSLLEGTENYFASGEAISCGTDRLLAKTWQVLDALCPKGSTSQIGLKVPSQTLVNLGLVSEVVRGEIVGRMNRKKQKDQPDDPQNKISFKRTGEEEITILKTYVSEESTELSFNDDEDVQRAFRLDKVMVEEFILTKKNDEFQMRMRTKVDNFHLHANGQRWISATPDIDNQWVEVTPGPRDLNRTLALIVEGLVPGYLGDKKLF